MLWRRREIADHRVAEVLFMNECMPLSVLMKLACCCHAYNRMFHFNLPIPLPLTQEADEEHTNILCSSRASMAISHNHFMHFLVTLLFGSSTLWPASSLESHRNGSHSIRWCGQSLFSTSTTLFPQCGNFPPCPPSCPHPQLINPCNGSSD